MLFFGLVDYSQKVSLLFQFGVDYPLFQFRRHFHSEKTIYLCMVVALQKVNNSLVLSFAFEKKCFPASPIDLSNSSFATKVESG